LHSATHDDNSVAPPTEFVTYAQNYEDVSLYRALKGVKNGFYVDVGAQDPDHCSVTKAFYERGWRGVNIEPVAEWYEKLKVTRPRDINLQFVAGREEGKITFYEFAETGMSTIREAIARQHIEAGFACKHWTAKVKRLANVLDEYVPADVHFMKIDVEGAEEDVIAGTDFDRMRPWILVVESTAPNSSIQNHESWDAILRLKNYEFVKFDALNRFYVAKEHAALADTLSLPPNMFDNVVRAHDWYDRLRGDEAIRDAEHKAKVLVQWDQAIKDRDHAIRARDEALQQLAQRLDETLNHVEGLRAEGVSLHQSLEQEHAALLDHQHAVGELHRGLREKEAVLNEMRVLLATQENAIETQQRTIATQHKQIDAQQAEIMRLQASACHRLIVAIRRGLNFR
jgi:FkbM family methyltransferase